MLWLLEELGLPYDLERVEFSPTYDRFFQQPTPLGKLPVLEDGELLLCESGAIVEYILERYGNGRLAPAVSDALRGPFLQWMHFAESTLFAPFGVVVWLTRYRDDGSELGSLVPDARERAGAGLEFLEEQLGDKKFILGDDFSAADIMLGFTLAAAMTLEMLDERFPKTNAYLGRLMERPAFLKAVTS